MADKTQLASMALATRYRLGTMLTGLGLGAAVVMGISTGIGAVIGEALPARAITIGAGIVFLIVGCWILISILLNRGLSGDDAVSSSKESEDHGRDRTDRKSGFVPAMVVAGTLTAAEFGDKTMLAAITLASGGHAIAVWLAGTLALFLLDAMAALLGDVIWRFLKPRIVASIAGGLFLLAGIWMFWDALSD